MTMKTSKKKLLEKKGYKVSDAQEFLGFTDEENAYIEKYAFALRQKL